MTVPERIQRALKKQGWRMTEMARSFGCSDSLIRHYKLGTRGASPEFLVWLEKLEAGGVPNRPHREDQRIVALEIRMAQLEARLAGVEADHREALTVREHKVQRRA